MGDFSEDPVPQSSRPSWQQAKCPIWCMMTHRETDALADRLHVSDEFQVWLHQQTRVKPPYGDVAGRHAVMYLRQHVSEKAPRVWLGIGDSGYGFLMFLHEGTSVASTLSRVVLLGETG